MPSFPSLSLPNSPFTGLLLPLGGLLVTYNLRRVTDYLYQKQQGQTSVKVNTNFGLVDGAIYLGSLALASRFTSTPDFSQSVVNTLAVYGLLSMLPEVSVDVTVDDDE